MPDTGEDMTKKWQNKFENFGEALERLEESLDQGEWNQLEKDGVIQRFEFTYELAWKTLQDYFDEQGQTDIKGPKKVIQQAFQDGLIVDEAWSDLIVDRNTMSHQYDGNASETIFEKIKDKYFQLLCDLYNRMESESK